MRVEEYTRSWRVTNANELAAAMASRDEKGGALFYIAPDDEQYPLLAIRVTGDYADVHYFPYGGHAGFRCLGGEGLPEDGWTSFLYQGCDPGTGEQTPNKFVMAFAQAREIADVFLRTGLRSGAVSWLEL